MKQVTSPKAAGDGLWPYVSKGSFRLIKRIMHWKALNIDPAAMFCFAGGGCVIAYFIRILMNNGGERSNR